MRNVLFLAYRPKQLFLNFYTFFTKKYTILQNLSKSTMIVISNLSSIMCYIACKPTCNSLSTCCAKVFNKNSKTTRYPY
jgi:hypothetical protein